MIQLHTPLGDLTATTKVTPRVWCVGRWINNLIASQPLCPESEYQPHEQIGHLRIYGPRDICAICGSSLPCWRRHDVPRQHACEVTR